jgi:hypothetical protein
MDQDIDIQMNIKANESMINEYRNQWNIFKWIVTN